MKLVLTGYMGSGKSAVGKDLSLKLGCPFVDLDEAIEASEKCSIAQLFSEKGEIYFRNIESRHLKRFINSEENSVLATGGGTLTYADNLDFLLSVEDVTIIHLKASLDTLTNRLLKEKNKRPLIAHLETKVELADFIRKHVFERSFYYNSASITIKVDELSISNITERIVLDLF